MIFSDGKRTKSSRRGATPSWLSFLPPDETSAVSPDTFNLLPRAFLTSRRPSRSRSASPPPTQSPDSSDVSSPPDSPPMLPYNGAFPLSRSRRGAGRSSSLTGGLDTFSRRRVVMWALALAIPVLCVLLTLEVINQKANTETWARELAGREAKAATGQRVDLAAWRRRWVQHRRSRSQDLMTQEDSTLQALAADAWPAWWGSSDVVGPSPFDHIPTPLKGKKRGVLFLTDYTDYLERMNTHTYEIVDAALRHPHLNVDVWGPGWAGYDWNVPLSVNVNRRANRVAALEASKAEHDAHISRAHSHLRQGVAGRIDIRDNSGEEKWTPPTWDYSMDGRCNPEVRFDLVWTMSDIYKADDMPHVDALDCGSLLVQQLGDCHEHRCLKEWYHQSNNITVTKYAFELPEIFEFDQIRDRFPSFNMGLFGHSPDTANEWDFYPVRWAEKTAKAAIFGFDGGFYPLRTTVTSYLQKAEEDTSLPPSPITRHPHPGYTVNFPEKYREHPMETYEVGHETYAPHRALREDFANGMRHSQICVFDASLERKMIRKYAQAFLSGCVVAGDIPTEHEEALSKFMIHLEPTWNIERIHEELYKYLAQPEKLHQMALDGLVYARKHLTSTAKITDMLRLVDAHRAGHRGYDQSFSFSNRCRTYWADDSQRPPWCNDRAEGYRGLEDRVYQ